MWGVLGLWAGGRGVWSDVTFLFIFAVGFARRKPWRFSTAAGFLRVRSLPPPRSPGVALASRDPELVGASFIFDALCSLNLYRWHYWKSSSWFKLVQNGGCLLIVSYIRFVTAQIISHVTPSHFLGRQLSQHALRSTSSGRRLRHHSLLVRGCP